MAQLQFNNMRRLAEDGVLVVEQKAVSLLIKSSRLTNVLPQLQGHEN